MKALLLLPICLGLMGCSTVALKSTEQPEPHARASGVLRTATYNTFVGARDSAETVAVIRRMNADVIALQEVMPERATILSRELSRDYRYRNFKGGLGMMSRFPMRKVHFERSRRGINGFIFAEIEWTPAPVQIANLHLDPLRTWTIGQKLTLPFQLQRQREIQRDELVQVFENLKPGSPTILLGDFNRASDTAVNRLRELGFTDSFAVVTPKADRVPTLHFSILGFRSGRRVDFIFHSSAFRTIRSTVFRGQPSDHDALASVLSLGENTELTGYENQRTRAQTAKTGRQQGR
ncbi:MAG TPA: endonuclease/exonuclease/phosphatase family protein [Chthoniobacteraceae bacterium]|nr:endonuclease/exonuclease/phosphatase family protein [Chthoniobacteraceae bacterium]